MLKFLLGVVGVIPLVLLVNRWNVVITRILLITFLFLMSLPYLGLFRYISYFMGLDILSYGLVLLSF
jgi:NADH-ubiquinone oxidoreductase chain 4